MLPQARAEGGSASVPRSDPHNGLGARITFPTSVSGEPEGRAAEAGNERDLIDPLDGMPNAIVARAHAKAEILAAFRVFKGHSCRTLNATFDSFVALYNDQRIEVSAGARELYGEISAPSLQRDWRRFRKSGIAGLIPGYGKRRGDTIIARNGSMREFIVASIAHNPRVRAPWLLEGLKVRFPNDRIASLGALQKFIRDWKRQNHSVNLRISDPAGWRNKHMLAIGDADANITRVNQLWEVDGTPNDAYVLGTFETPGGRLALIAAIDVYSRKPVLHLAPSESSNSIEALFLKAFPLLGLPEEISHDNGAGFISERTQRGMARLGIRWPAMPAYQGWKKPFVERNFRTALHGFIANLPGFIGHNVSEAAKIRERAGHAPGRGMRRNMRRLYRIELTAPELQELLDQWVEHVYGNTKHSGLGGRTPNEVFAEAERRGQIRRVTDDRLLDLVLGEDGIAIIGKKGLRAGNLFYWDDALVEHVGQTVQFVRTRDAGKLIVYTADSAPRFICIAVNPESAGLDREVMAIAGKQRQAAVMREEMEGLRDLKKRHRPETVYREIIENAVAADAAAIRPDSGDGAINRVGTLPYRSAALTAAAAALEALETSKETEPHDEETLKEGAIALADIEQRREIREMLLDDDELNALWIAIRREPRVLTLREQRYLAHFHHTADAWADSYETTDEFRALKLRLSAA